MTDPTHSGAPHSPLGAPSSGHPSPRAHPPASHGAASHPRQPSQAPRSSRAGRPIWARLGGGAAIVVVIVWITLPPRGVALDDRCEPDGVAAALSAAVYGNTFWRSQQTALNNEILILSGLPAADIRARDQQQAGALERKMDRLSNQEASGDAAAQEKALADEQHARMERMAQLVRCQGPVTRHLGGAQ
jgi:hypothetical protein